ncbi:MAG: hypothetical protein C0506_06295 [Anaerolinea sp.]|nr:hypothetical protein [Anaerolinea sp.]
MRANGAAEPLTKRQEEVLRLLARGRTNFEIAQALGISLDGAKWHVREVLGRLGVDSREAAADIWRREHGLARRLVRGGGWLLAIGPAKGALAAAGIAASVAVAVAGGVYLLDSGQAPSAPAVPEVASPSPNAGASPGSPLVIEVIAIARAGDLAAFKRLMRTFPHECSNINSDQVPCPPGVAEGSQVDAFSASSATRGVVWGEDQESLLDTTVPVLTTLHAVTRVRTYGLAPPRPQFQVVVRGYNSTEPSLDAAVYFLDEDGIVGFYAGDLRAIDIQLNDAAPEDWIVVRPAVASFAPDKPLYVVGRDTEIRFAVRTPQACNGLDLVLRLYALPEAGAPGGVQAMKEPGLVSEIHSPASSSGTTGMTYPLPGVISRPMYVRPAVDAACLGEPVFSGLSLALQLPEADSRIAVFEVPGAWLDLRRPQGPTYGEYLGGALTAFVGDVLCTTASLADPAARNDRGNVEIRVGAAGQPGECNAPGQPVRFVAATGLRLAEKPAFVAGASQLVANLGPEPPH